VMVLGGCGFTRAIAFFVDGLREIDVLRELLQVQGSARRSDPAYLLGSAEVP